MNFSENDKLVKRKRFTKEMMSQTDDINLMEYWTKSLSENNKKRLEFYGRSISGPNQIAPLYTNLKIDETPATKNAT